MPKAPLLSESEIAARLRDLRSWRHSGDALERTFRLSDFREAVGFLVRITGPADEQNHHPDVAIHWNEVTLRLWTHASGGITERDILLARTIDQMTEG